MTKSRVITIKINDEDAMMIAAVTKDLCLDNKSAAILALVRKHYREMKRCLNEE